MPLPIFRTGQYHCLATNARQLNIYIKMKLINKTTPSVKRNTILALREMLELANMSDADVKLSRLRRNETEPNDLESHHACGTHGLYSSVRACLVSLGQRETIEKWAESGEWPDLPVFFLGDTVEMKFLNAYDIPVFSGLGEIVEITSNHVHVQSLSGFIKEWNLDGSPCRSDSKYFLVRHSDVIL